MIDALHKTIYGESLTNATYIKHKHGPVPGPEGYELLKETIESGDIEVFEEMVSPGKYEQNHYLYPGLKPVTTDFTMEQMNIISWAVSIVKEMTAEKLSELSHDSCYRNTPMFGEIDLGDVCNWKINEGPYTYNLGERDFSEIDFDELNNIIQNKQTAAH